MIKPASFNGQIPGVSKIQTAEGLLVDRFFAGHFEYHLDSGLLKKNCDKEKYPYPGRARTKQASF